MTSISYPSGRVVQQNYDVIGRLSSILSGTTTYLSVPTTGGYNSAQLPLALNYGSGVAGAFQYNDHLQMSSLNYSLSGTSLLNLSYNYLDAQGHNNGQIQGITDSRGDAFSTLYSYDPLGRLIHAQTKDLTAANTWNLLWNYDIYGNRLPQSAGSPSGTLTTSSPSFLIDPATNRIAPGSGFNYDPAGNVIQDPSYTYTYNAEGELVKSVRSSDGMTATYAYDGHRWRMQKTSSGATTVYIYSGSKVLAEYAAGAAPSAPSKEYVYSGGSLLATLAGTSVTYHYPDHLSNRLETNSAGTVTRTFGHLPFGETWYETGTPDKWKFTGYERDTTESGLDYAMNRMYSSGYGRFEAADLLAGSPGAPQSLNRYSYVSGDPLSLIDPAGLAQHPILYEPTNWGCTLDGIASPCDLVLSVIGGGGAVECPGDVCEGINQDGLPVDFHATTEGSYYSCMLSGIWSTQNAAGQAAEGCANGASIALNKEYSGNIYKLPDGSFSFTKPTTGTAASSPFNPAAIPDGTSYAGNYHTHGAFDIAYDSEQFSPVGCNGGQLCDIGIAMQLNMGQPSYLGTPAGRIEVFDPAQFASFPYGCVLVGPAVSAAPGTGTSSVPVPKCP